MANANTGNIGISFMGTHTTTPATSTQLCSAAKLLAQLHQDFSAIARSRGDVKGHRQQGSTSCPGDALCRQSDLIVGKAGRGCDAR